AVGVGVVERVVVALEPLPVCEHRGLRLARKRIAAATRVQARRKPAAYYARLDRDQVEHVAPVDGKLFDVRLVDVSRDAALLGFEQGDGRRYIDVFANSANRERDIELRRLAHIEHDRAALGARESGLLDRQRISAGTETRYAINAVRVGDGFAHDTRVHVLECDSRAGNSGVAGIGDRPLDRARKLRAAWKRPDDKAEQSTRHTTPSCFGRKLRHPGNCNRLQTRMHFMEVVRRCQAPSGKIALLVFVCGAITAMAQSPYQTALADVQQRRNERAIPVLEKLLAASPNDLKARNLLGIALLNSGRRDEGAVQFRKAIAVDPAFYQALKNLALIELAQHKRADARTHLEQVLKSAPNDVAVHFNLGELDYGDKRYAQAAMHYERSIPLVVKDG